MKEIFVTKPSLPLLEELIPHMEAIWDSGNVTNCSHYHTIFESALCDYLGVEHLSLFTNATIGLISALKSLKIHGEVITTPYSFIATSHSISWNNCTPVFVDIELPSYNINPSQIQAAITDKTTAIMPVHCYGVGCNFREIDRIACKNNLKVIYDGAHVFGPKAMYRDILNNGDITVLSFHGTKVFNTFEGGAVISRNAEIKKQIDNIRNFGITSEVSVEEIGINGKMSEFNAALGILQLNHIDDYISSRARIANLYNFRLGFINGIITPSVVNSKITNNSYYPILITNDFPLTRDSLYAKLKSEKINPRRYFFPLISAFPMYSSLTSSKSSNLPVATEVSNQILCLPIYPALTDYEINKICDIIQLCAKLR